MEPITPASFIPKRPIEPVRTAGVGLFFLASLLLFVLSVAAAGGVFAYSGYLNSSIESKKTSLKNSEGAYDLPAIQDLVRIDARMAQAKVLLQKHTAPSAVFDILSQLTLAQVQLLSFDYALQGNGQAQVKVTGVGRDFSTVALQSDQFGASRALRDVIFSGVTIDQQGEVAFSVSATVEPAAISYAKNIAASPALPAAEQSAAPATPTSPTAAPQPTPKP